MARILLANNCYCSKLSVHPKNWKSSKALTNTAWYISYRFYDPTRLGPDGKIKPVQKIIKGMNEYSDLQDRRAATEVLMENEINILKKLQFNPITGFIKEELGHNQDISPDTPFSVAMDYVFNNIKLVAHTKEDLKSVKKFFMLSCDALNYSDIPIGEIKRKHIRYALDNCKNVKKIWTANQFNHYRRNLSILFNELIELEVMEYNPIIGIKKMQAQTRIRPRLSDQQRIKVDQYLHHSHYNLWRFVQIFFHSGCRLTEIIQVKISDIDFEQQEFIITVKKGRSSRQVKRIIKDVALPFWMELKEVACPGDFIFNTHLVPGVKHVSRDHLSRLWKKIVKDNAALGIVADLYSLKHSNLDETAAILDIQAAQDMAGHSSPVITMKHYATGEVSRQQQKLKKVNNSFAKASGI